jgi:hypothetical protein
MISLVYSYTKVNNFQFIRNMMKIGPTAMLSNEFSGMTSTSIVASFEFNPI